MLAPPPRVQAWLTGCCARPGLPGRPEGRARLPGRAQGQVHHLPDDAGGARLRSWLPSSLPAWDRHLTAADLEVHHLRAEHQARAGQRRVLPGNGCPGARQHAVSGRAVGGARARLRHAQAGLGRLLVRGGCRGPRSSWAPGAIQHMRQCTSEDRQRTHAHPTRRSNLPGLEALRDGRLCDCDRQCVLMCVQLTHIGTALHRMTTTCVA